MVYTAIKEIIKSFLEELKCILKEYVNKQEIALKARLKKILIISITGMVILALAISLAGAASLFFLIGTLRYLETFLPAWQAWLIMAATAAVIATVLFTALYFIIRKQLTTPKATTEQQTVNNQ
jgi:phosphotransferase system  glucose/maltose/N-acetylglucosamine-specific IIC component